MLNLHADNFAITPLQYRAVRACDKLLAISTAGWDEMHGCDRHFDGGEWSDPAWADNWDTEIGRVANLVAGRFGLDGEKLRTTWEYHAPYDEEGRQQGAMLARRAYDRHLRENHLALMCGESREEF